MSNKKKIQLMDCTLRDGANVVGKGFSAEITDMVLDGLTSCKVPIIEFGNAGGIGAYEVAGFTNALTDSEYLEIAKKYLNRGSEIGMFLNAKRYREKYVDMAAENGLAFLRVGADAGDGSIALQAIADIKKRGMKAYYSAMKAYLLTADELAEECDFFSIGTNDLTQYTCALDRQNAKLEPFFNPHHPAVLRAIKMTIDAGHRHGIWVGICGELGADTALTETFLRMGVDELSMNAKSVLPVRKIIRSIDLSKPSDK